MLGTSRRKCYYGPPRFPWAAKDYQALSAFSQHLSYEGEGIWWILIAMSKTDQAGLGTNMSVLENAVHLIFSSLACIVHWTRAITFRPNILFCDASVRVCSNTEAKQPKQLNISTL